MQTRGYVFEVFPETLHNCDRVTRHGVVGGPRAEQGKCNHKNNNQAARSTLRHKLAQLLLAVLEQILYIRRQRTAVLPGITLSAVAFRWRHQILLIS